MKKFTAIVTAIAMSLTLVTPVFAASETDEAIYTLETEFNEVRQSPSGEYAIFVPASSTGKIGQYLPVGRLDISIASLARSNDLLDCVKLELETKEYIEKLKEQAIQEGEHGD